MTAVDGGRALTHDATVSRELVHVRAVAEIFLTDAEPLDEDRFVLGTQLPRGHLMWADRPPGHHDPLVTVEIGRQAAFLVAHRYCGVPTSDPCLLHTVDLRVEDLSAFVDDGRACPEGRIEARVLDRRYSDDGGLSAMGFEGDLWLGDGIAVTMTGEMAVFTRPDYTVLRAQSRGGRPLGDPPPPSGRLTPERVGRRDPRNVVVGEATGEPPEPLPEAGSHRYRLIVDTTHPGLFDHRHDHITGSLMLESYRQAALAAAVEEGLLDAPHAVVTRCRLAFHGLGELDEPAECRVRVEPARGGVRAELTLVQAGRIIADAGLELTPPG